MRAVGDPEADEVVRQVFERRQFSELNAFVSSLSGAAALPDNLPTEIRAFVDRTSARPEWVQDMHLRRAEHFFVRHGLASMMALVCASLPECYTMRRGVRILALTRQLGAHVDRRLHQTALMVLAVMGPHGLDRGGLGVVQAQRVRLIHAAIRHLVLLGQAPQDATPDEGYGAAQSTVSRSIGEAMARAGFKWSVADDGQPLNQEDLAFTLLTFSYILPLAMSRFGVPVTEDDHLDFLRAISAEPHYLPVHFKRRLTEAMLLFLGYDVRRLDCRVLLRGLVVHLKNLQTSDRIALLQIDPEEEDAPCADELKKYMEGCCKEVQIEVYWGSVRDFLRELRERREGNAGD